MPRITRNRIAVRLFAVAALCAALLPIGCRKPHVSGPLTPELRGPVNDLVAVRSGNQLWLSWTMPKRSTGKLAVNGLITARVCRRETAASACADLGESLHLARGAAGTFSETLSEALAAGSPRVLYYFVQLMDRNGHPTGLSNSVGTLAGAPPAAVQGLTAEMTPNGVLLRWTPSSSVDRPSAMGVRLRRVKLSLNPPATGTQPGSGALAPQQTEKNLWVENGAQAGQALDPDVHDGDTYEYSAQRVARIPVGSQALEMAGQFSGPVDITVKNDIRN